MSAAAVNSAAAAGVNGVPSYSSRPPSRSGGGLLERVRSSFSSSVRPTIVHSPSVDSQRGGMRGPSATWSRAEGNGIEGIPAAHFHTTNDGRLRKRRSLFRKNGRDAKMTPPVPVVPPQLTLPLTSDAPATENGVDEAELNVGALSQSNAAAQSPQKYVFSTSASLKRQLESHTNARLTARQATSLFEQCASEIKQRGLAMVGIFRPFRLAESNAEVERLIELFLLSSEPKEYQGIFALETTIASTMFRETLGKPDPKVEFRRKLSYAHVFDVIALFKWGLRRLDLHLFDLKSAQQYTWYDNFAKQEKAQGYPVTAFSQLLLSSLSSDMANLLQVVFDLMSTVSAHHLTNAMPARRISRTVGYWLFGRVGVDHEPINFASTYAAWERSGQVTEHLLLAFIREQSSKFHLMPSRLTELVRDYPYIAPNAKAPSLPPSFVPPEQTALLIESRTENVVLTPKQPRRTPKEILQSVIKAQNADLETSEDLDDWVAMLNLAAKENQDALEILADADEGEGQGDAAQIDGANVEVGDESTFFADEDVRILDIVNAELQKHKDIFDGKLTASASNGTLSRASESGDGLTTYDSASSLFSRQTFDSSITSPALHGQTLSTLSENAEEGKFDWSAFSSSGFANSSPQVDRLEFDRAFRPKNELERVFEEQDRAEALAMDKKMRRKNDNRMSPLFEKRGPPKFVLSGVSTLTIDDCFAAVWQDQLMDECPAARLPHLICAQLNQRMASNLLGNAASKITNSTSNQWLIVHESVIAPRPPMPPAPASSSTFFRKNTMGRKQASLRRGRQSEHGPMSEFGSSKLNDDDDRQSLFSIRSGFSAHFARPANGVRKMKSMLLSRKSSSAAINGDIGSERKAEIDAEVQELQAVVNAHRESKLNGDASKVNGSAAESIRSNVLASSAYVNGQTPAGQGTDYAKQASN